jgi:hypothetical protein
MDNTEKLTTLGTQDEQKHVYQDFLHRDLLPTVKLLEQGFMVVELKSPR